MENGDVENGSKLNIEELIAQQQAFEEKLKQDKEAADEKAKQQVATAQATAEMDEQLKQYHELEDSIPGGIDKKATEKQRDEIDALDASLAESETELSQVQNVVKEAESDLETLMSHPLVRGKTEEELAPSTREARDKYNADIEAKNSQIENLRETIEKLRQERQTIETQIAEKEGPIKKAEQIEQNIKDIKERPGTEEAIMELAKRENEIRAEFVKDALVEINRGYTYLHPGTEASKVRDEFSQDVLQQYVTEEIARRGYDDLPPEERLAKIEEMTNGMLYGMQRDPYHPSSGESQEISQIKNEGRTVIDKLHGMAIKTLLGSGRYYPSIAISVLGYASTYETGEPHNVLSLNYELDQHHRYDRRVPMFKNVIEEQNKTEEQYQKIRQDILAHNGTFIKLKNMASKQKYGDVKNIYLGSSDWDIGGGMEDYLHRLRINVSQSSLEPNEWINERDQHVAEYNQRTKQHEPLNEIHSRQVEEKKGENVENLKKDLEKSKEALAKAQAQLKEIKDLASQKEKIESEINLARQTEWQKIDELKKHNHQFNMERTNLVNKEPRGLQKLNRAKFQRDNQLEIDDINAMIEKNSAEISDIEKKPSERSRRLEEVTSRLKELGLAYDLERGIKKLEESIDYMEKTLPENER